MPLVLAPVPTVIVCEKPTAPINRKVAKAKNEPHHRVRPELALLRAVDPKDRSVFEIVVFCIRSEVLVSVDWVGNW